jgi:hypothetical protein
MGVHRRPATTFDMDGTNGCPLNNALAGASQVLNGVDTSKLRLLPKEVRFQIYQAALDGHIGDCHFEILLYDGLNSR